MTTTLTAIRPVIDPHVAAFCAPGGPEVFCGIVHGNQVWTADPYDVKSIHAEAREIFDRLLARASSPELPATGKTLVLLGEAGSGKTHLLRAFRTAAHERGAGYCGYLQMTTRADNYARYTLGYLIDSLDHPYKPDQSQTGFQRLAAGLLDALDIASDEDKERLTGDQFASPDELGRLVHRLAHLAVQTPRFKGIHVDVLRAVLDLLSPDERVHALAMRWLRCENLDKFDRELLGDLVPRPQPEMAIKTIWDLGRLMYAVETSALVLLVDQIEEVMEMDSHTPQKWEAFRQAVNTLVEVVDGLPNAVVVIGCLEDLFMKGKDELAKSKLDRLMVDPEPIRLNGTRTEDEVRDLVSRRLEVLFDELEVPSHPSNPLAPYSASDLLPLSNMRSRDILDNLRRHRIDCQKQGWTAPNWKIKGQDVETLPPNPNRWAEKWNDFKAEAPGARLETVDQLVDLLADTIHNASYEMLDDIYFSAHVEGNLIAIDQHRGDGVDRFYVCLCEKNVRGGGLANQLRELLKTVGEVPTVLVRSTEFPRDGKQQAALHLAKLVKPRGNGRKVVVSDSDWRAMAAFNAFFDKHRMSDDFATWQQTDRPLSGLPAVAQILDLPALLARSEPPAPPFPPLPKTGTVNPLPSPLPLPDPLTSIRLGQSTGITASPVELNPNDLTRHAAFLGGSGSGKTTAALTIIEELLWAGIPAILLDRKGDLSRYAFTEAWTTPEPDAERAERRKQLGRKLDIALYTPGNENGRPLCIPVVPSGLKEMKASERELAAQFAAASLNGMLGYRSNSPDPKRVILQKAIEVLAVASDEPVTVKRLQRVVIEMDDALVNETAGYEEKHFKKLGQDLLTLSLQHRRLLEDGELLDMNELLGRHRIPGCTQLSIINTQFLGDAGTIDFWVSQFLLSVDRWRAKNPSDKLQAVILFDEADKYLPATGVIPTTKGPMENLLKRARSAGIGLFLATQSPGDLDYRCRDQILTWLVGRVRELRALDKLKPMFERRPDSLDKLAGQKAGEFYLVRESEVGPIRVHRNLVPTEQMPEDRILQQAKMNTGDVNE